MNIKIERVRNRMSQTDLAKILGISRPTMEKYESSPDLAPGRILVSMADIFDVSVDYLLERSEERRGSNGEQAVC